MKTIRQSLYDRYHKEISEWLPSIVSDDDWYTEEGFDCEWQFIGTVRALVPSGQYGFTKLFYGGGIGVEEMQDEEFMHALDDVASELCCWIEGGEGDPCDLFVYRSLDEADNETE